VSREHVALTLEVLGPSGDVLQPMKPVYRGDAVGKGATLERLGRLAQDGVTISFDIHDIVGNDEHVVVLTDATVSKGGSSSVGRQVQVMHVRDGTWAEVWVSNEDQAAVDAVLNS